MEETAGAPMAHFKANLDRGIFLVQQCDACSRAVFYPRVLCPHCGADRLSWRQASGQGVVHSTTVVRRSAEKGGDYNVALIDLAEGVRLMSRVDGLPANEVRIGLPVRMAIRQVNGSAAAVFEPAARLMPAEVEA